MVGYSKVNVKLSDTQLKKQTALRIILKMVNGNDLPYKLLLTTKQKTKKKKKGI